MLLVDADYLEEKAIQFPNTSIYVPIEAVWGAPAIDVVRCKDCVHRALEDIGEDIDGTDLGKVSCCVYFGYAMSSDGFCSYGKRRSIQEESYEAERD